MALILNLDNIFNLKGNLNFKIDFITPFKLLRIQIG